MKKHECHIPKADKVQRTAAVSSSPGDVHHKRSHDARCQTEQYSEHVTQAVVCRATSLLASKPVKRITYMCFCRCYVPRPSHCSGPWNLSRCTIFVLAARVYTHLQLATRTLSLLPLQHSLAFQIRTVSKSEDLPRSWPACPFRNQVDRALEYYRAGGVPLYASNCSRTFLEKVVTQCSTK